MNWLRLARIGVRETPTDRRVFLSDHPVTTMFKAAAFSLAALLFVSTIVALIFDALSYESIVYASVAIGGSVTLAAGTRQWLLMRGGSRDLVLQHGVWILPATLGRDQPVSLPLSTIKEITPAVEVAKEGDALDADQFGPKRWVKRPAKQPDEIRDLSDRGQGSYAVLIVWDDETGAERAAPIVVWTAKRRAHAFTHWLREQLPVAPGPSATA